MKQLLSRYKKIRCLRAFLEKKSFLLENYSHKFQTHQTFIKQNNNTEIEK